MVLEEVERSRPVHRQLYQDFDDAAYGHVFDQGQGVQEARQGLRCRPGLVLQGVSWHVAIDIEDCLLTK